jgi:hypothetical protein
LPFLACLAFSIDNQECSHFTFLARNDDTADDVLHPKRKAPERAGKHTLFPFALVILGTSIVAIGNAARVIVNVYRSTG